MNRGTPDNIMTQLAMTADDYNLVTVMYYVGIPRESNNESFFVLLTCSVDPVHHRRGAVESAPEALLAIQMAIAHHDHLGHCASVPLRRHQQERAIRSSILLGFGKTRTHVNEMEQSANYDQAEAGQFPGVILQMCYWYRPDEMSLRLLYFCKCIRLHLIDAILTFRNERHLRQSIRNIQRYPRVRL